MLLKLWAGGVISGHLLCFLKNGRYIYIIRYNKNLEKQKYDGTAAAGLSEKLIGIEPQL